MEQLVIGLAERWAEGVITQFPVLLFLVGALWDMRRKYFQCVAELVAHLEKDAKREQE